MVKNNKKYSSLCQDGTYGKKQQNYSLLCQDGPAEKKQDIHLSA
jgi:hypothetical protein